MSLPTRLLHSAWSAPPAAPRRGIDHHVEQWAAWLRRAGAEPRLCLVLCAGKGARSRMAEGLSALGVRVQGVTSTMERPLPREILDHQGDHFNDLLFLIDGFAEHDPARQFEVLEGQRRALKRTATWVGVMVENLRALERLATFAPQLFREFGRRIVVLAAGASDEPSPNPQLLEAWRADGRVAELLFVDALTPSQPPASYDDFSRLVRSGYVGNFVGQPIHPDRARMVALWASGPGGVADAAAHGAPLSPVWAAALARHGGPLPAPLAAAVADALAGDPLSRVAGGLPVADHADAQRLAAVAAPDAPPSSLAEPVARACGAGVPDDWAAHLWMALGSAHAAAGDLDATLLAVRAARARAEAAAVPELLFEVLDTQVRLLTFTHDRTGAQVALAKMAELALTLQSPYHQAGHLAARAAFTEPLDPRRAVGDYQAAAALFSGFGWADEAAAAQAGAARCL